MRRTGRTTRLIDKAIQDLFTLGEITIIDHDSAGRLNASRDMFRKTRMRLYTEHQYLVDTKQITFIANKHKIILNK